MHISRRLLLAIAAGATFATLAYGQAGQLKPGAGQPKSNTVDLPTSLGGKNLKQWMAEIKSTDPSRRENAIRTIPMLKGAEEAIPLLLDRVARDNDSSPRVSAVMALGAIPTPPDTIDKIVETLRERLISGRESQAIIRYHCALALGRFGEKARPALHELIGATKDPGSWEIRKAAVFALARTITELRDYVNSQGLEALLQRMYISSELSVQVRLEATMSVATLGKVRPEDNKKLVQALQYAEQDREKMVSIWARVGLCVHDNRLTKEDISALVKFLRADELPQRTHAARALGTIAAVGNPGALINPAIPALIKMLDDKEELGQIAAIWSLGQIGAPAEPALKRLNEMLQDKTVSDEGKAFVREAIEMIQRRAKR